MAELAVLDTSCVPDNATPEKAKEVIHRCPSGALKYSAK
ncbi:hypothetical protein HB852_14485 [Listeria grandensis]|nr:hypothetical protein [Listeria grandensis]MBC6315618.1 hypothetical protein [Listeria grandensis]